MKPLVSIIIPVYNVEEFLERCLDSVVNQSYRNIEIILVNDGSTDASLEICKKYYNKYSTLIRIVNKENGGLSSARNSGIKSANGAFICFIDSDDYVDEKYVEILLDNIIRTNAEISCCNYKRTNKQMEKGIYCKNLNLLKNDDAIDAYLKYEMTSACGKMYNRNLFSNISFPEGKIYEDIVTNFKILMKCNSIVINNSILYMYYIRPGSITMSSFKEKNLHLLDAWNDVLYFAKKYNVNIYNKAKYRRNRVFFTLLAIIARYGFDKNISRSKQNIIINFLKTNYDKSFWGLFVSKFTPFNRKIAMLCFRVSYKSCFYFGYFLRNFVNFKFII